MDFLADITDDHPINPEGNEDMTFHPKTRGTQTTLHCFRKMLLFPVLKTLQKLCFAVWPILDL